MAMPEEEKVAPPPQENEESSKPDSHHEFNPSRMIGIIRRKAMIRDLAAVYHAECLAYCQELLQLQKKWEEETCIDVKAHEDLVKDNMRPNKRSKKAR